MKLKPIFLILGVVFYFLNSPLVYSQNKDVIIVLDESGSMEGDKWESVRYAMQLVTALLDESDNYYIIRQNGTFVRAISLTNKQNSINEIQSFKPEYLASHDSVIQHAVDQMKRNPGRKKLLLFYGDGDWESVEERIRKSCSDLIANYSKIKPELYFLKVEDRPSLLGQISAFEREMSTIELFEVIPTNPKNKNELTTNLQNISKKIAGADKGMAGFTLSESTLSFDVKFPLKKLLVIYQKEASQAFPDVRIKSLKCNQDLDVSKKLNMESKMLKGKYFEVKGKRGALINEGQTVKIELDKTINKNYIFVIPIISANLVTKFSSEFESVNVNKNEYIVCEETQSIELTSFLADQNDDKILSLDGVAVIATNGSNTFPFSNKNEEAVGAVSLLSDTTYISVEARYEGYFQQKDKVITVIKKRCRSVIDTSAIDLGRIPFFEFIRNKHCVGITYTINDDVVFPGNYSLKVKGLPFGITCSIDSTGNSFRVCFSKSNWICDCMVPSGNIKGSFVAVPKTKEVVSTVKSWKFEIVKEGSLFKRCKNCLIWLVVVILFFTYLYGVIKKPRFDRTAKFEVSEIDKMAIYAPPNKKPRKKLPTGFFSRFLIPFKSETRIVDGMKIIASSSKSTVMIAKESLSEKMSKNGEPVNPKAKKDLKIFRNNTLEIEKTPAITKIYTYRVK